MEHNYTRQRQGRDFPVPTPPDEKFKIDRQKKDFLKSLKRHKAEVKRNYTPIDGFEPDGISPEKVR
ncbi:hypothetical protein FACS1894208_12590 [Clostridia bacterium]|nr:hypothetical protein FACS1894208_12590 [Clostridia bacterium]